MCRNNSKFFFVNGMFILDSLKIKHNFEFLHMQLKFEIIWMRIRQVIRLQNDNFCPPPSLFSRRATKLNPRGSEPLSLKDKAKDS